MRSLKITFELPVPVSEEDRARLLRWYMEVMASAPRDVKVQVSGNTNRLVEPVS